MTDPINDAEAYGVQIVAADVVPGAEYWKAIYVHHLTPDENNGKHHIYLDAVDADGARLHGSIAMITWDDNEENVVIDKPEGEPGANFPMWKWQICNAEMKGLPTDRVENLHTDHNDEPPGNTLFHHSFAVTFERAIAEALGPEESVIFGRVPEGAGHNLVLLRGEVEVRRAVVAADESYRFENLGAGQYKVWDQEDDREIGPLEMDGENEVEVDFPQPLPEKPLARYLLFGPADLPVSQLHLSLLADYLSANHLAFGFDPDDAEQAQRVTLVGDHPAGVQGALEAAGCAVEQLPADPSALLAALS